MMQGHCTVLAIAIVCASLLAGYSEGQQPRTISGRSDASAFDLKGASVVDGVIVLDGSSGGEAEALYKEAQTLTNSSGGLLSFSAYFTFSTNATYGNGTIAFVIVRDGSDGEEGLAAARATLSVEFNSSCSLNGSAVVPTYGGGRGFRGGGGRGGPGGPFYGDDGRLGGLQVLEYAANTSVDSQTTWTSPPDQDLYPRDGSGGPYFCSAQPDAYPLYQYQVVIEYNASTHSLGVGTPNCGPAIARFINFSQDLSPVLTGSVRVGFAVSSGAIYNVSQWNFTSNPSASALNSLALLVSSGSAASSGGDDGVGGPGGRDGGRGGGGGSSSKKGFVIGFSVLGAAIGAAVIFGVCCLCCRKKPLRKSTVARSVNSGQIPEGAIIFEATKPAQAYAKEHDTAPLRHQSADYDATGTASWLKPVTAR